jgi:hypothetical protein
MKRQIDERDEAVLSSRNVGFPTQHHRQEGGGGILPAGNTYTPATGGTEGDESYMRHAVGEGFLVVPCPRALTFTAEEPHRLAERAKGDCYTNRAHKTQELIVWYYASPLEESGSVRKP